MRTSRVADNEVVRTPTALFGKGQEIGVTLHDSERRSPSSAWGKYGFFSSKSQHRDFFLERGKFSLRKSSFTEANF
jgi:hypothetical protein